MVPPAILTEPRERYKLALAAEVLASGGTLRLQAQGTSMLPSIWPGDVLSIEHKPGKEIVPGDIVLVARDSRFFVHRLIEKHNSRWITRGDSLAQNDESVAEVQVLGKVSLIHRKTGVIVPNPRVSRLGRTLAWMLCHWDVFRNIAVRIDSFWQRRARLGLFSRKAACRISSLVSATRTLDTDEPYLSACGE